jgi:hypothetical protein
LEPEEDETHWMRIPLAYDATRWVGYNKNVTKAGPICVAARNANGAQIMIITYLLPLLEKMGLVCLSGERPNTTWLLET